MQEKIYAFILCFLIDYLVIYTATNFLKMVIDKIYKRKALKQIAKEIIKPQAEEQEQKEKEQCEK